tara:strand:+ start:4937 stop:5584 length:648 start_codon:yes stop_codon:yes gene_type:complete
MKLNILVPDSLNDITLNQYQKFDKINTEDNKGSSFILHKMIEIFCNVDLKDIATIKYNDVNKVSKHISKLFENKPELIPTFTHNNIEYGFIPQLDDMTLGEYIDLDNYLSEWKTNHKAMSVLYRPIKHKRANRYQIEDYDGANNNLKDMPLDVVFGAMFFFYLLNEELLKITLKYLEKETTETLTLQQKETLAQNGVFINRFTDLLRGMSQNLIQ